MRCALLSVGLLMLCGCSLLESFYTPDPKTGESTADSVVRVVKCLPYGDIIAGVIGLGGLAYGGNRHVAHKKLRKEHQVLKSKVPTPPPSAPAT